MVFTLFIWNDNNVDKVGSIKTEDTSLISFDSKRSYKKYKNIPMAYPVADFRKEIAIWEESGHWSSLSPIQVPKCLWLNDREGGWEGGPCYVPPHTHTCGGNGRTKLERDSEGRSPLNLVLKFGRKKSFGESQMVRTVQTLG